MAIYVKTANGAKCLGEKVTQKKVIKALGYTPSDFDGDYNSLDNKPDIIDDGNSSLIITDPNGNIIAKIDENGITTTNLNAEQGITSPNDTLEITDLNGNVILMIDKDGVHTVGLKIKNKSLDTIIEENTPSGDYNELENKPEILEDSSAVLNIVDSNGNIIATIDHKGVHSLNFYVGINDDEVALKKDIPADVSLDEVNEKISNLETATENLPTLESDVETLKTDVENLETNQATLQTNVGTLNTDVENIKNVQGVIQEDVNTLKTNQETTNTSIQNLQSEQNKLNDKVDNIIDDESDRIQFVDEQGNIVMEVDGTGLNVVDVKINGESIVGKYQPKLTAGAGITIDDTGVISSEQGKPINCAYMYSYYTYDDVLDYPDLDFSKAVSTYRMYEYNTYLTSITRDFSSAVNMKYMFDRCTNLKNAELVTPNVRNIKGIFMYCGALESVIIDTSKVKDMSYAFVGCKKLTNVEIDTSNVENMSYMFATTDDMSANYVSTNTTLKTIPLYNTSNVKNMTAMFLGCIAFENFPEIDTSNVESMSHMFYGGKQTNTTLPNLNTSLKNIKINTNSVKNMYSMFGGCAALEKVEMSKYNIEYSFTGADIFEHCYSLKIVIIREFGSSYVMSDAFKNCYHFNGTVNETYNPNGDKDGYIYVPSSMVDTLKAADGWSDYADQIRALEDHTVDGTTTGELDESKI